MSLASAFALSRRTGLGFAVIGLCWGTVAALVPELKARIGAGDALFGLVLLASAFGLLTANWLAPWADRRLGGFGLPVAAILLALSFPLLGLVQTPLAYGAMMLILGGLSGLTDVLANARVSEMEARHGRSLMNVNHALFSVAYALAAIVAGLGREGGLTAFEILVVPAVVVLVMAGWMYLPPDDVEARADGPGSALPMGVVTTAGLIVLVAFGTEAAIESWSALHIERTLAGRAAEGALGPAMLGATMALGRLAGQTVAERWPDGAVLRGAALLTAVGLILAAAAQTPAMGYLGFAVAGLGVSVIGPIGIALAGRLVPPRHRTQAIARAAILGFCGFFLAPPAMGLMSEFGGLRLAFAAVAGFVLMTLVLERRLTARRPISAP